MLLFSPGLRAQIRKELLCILRDPRARAVLIGPPLVQLLVFAFAATLEVRNATIAVYDRDGGVWSRELLQRCTAASFVGHVRAVHSEAELRDLIDRRQALLAIAIPAEFSRALAAKQPAVVQVVVDGRRANSGQVALGYLETIVGELGAQVASSGRPSAPDAVVRHWFNPNLTYRWFIVPGLAGILAMLTALILTSLSIARERELGTFDQLLVSPATPTEIIVAKCVPALLIGTVLGMAMVAAGALLFQIPLRGSVPLLALTMMLFILSVVGVGLMLSAISMTQQQAILGAFALAVPMILMSGFATPVENMPGPLRLVAEALPLRHFMVIVQGTFLKALPLADVWAHTWPLMLISLITLGTATLWVRGRLQ